MTASIKLSAETQLHVRLTEQAGCGHPSYYVFNGNIVEGYCKLCRSEAVKHDPSWRTLDPDRPRT